MESTPITVSSSCQTLNDPEEESVFTVKWIVRKRYGSQEMDPSQKRLKPVSPSEADYFRFSFFLSDKSVGFVYYEKELLETDLFSKLRSYIKGEAESFEDFPDYKLLSYWIVCGIDVCKRERDIYATHNNKKRAVYIECLDTLIKYFTENLNLPIESTVQTIPIYFHTR